MIVNSFQNPCKETMKILYFANFFPHFFARLQFWAYRFRTVVASCWYLLMLDSERTNRFLDSYEAFKHDWSDKDEMVSEMGEGYYVDMAMKVVDYYTVVCHLCALGDVEKMYIPPTLDPSKGIIENQDLFEERLCSDLNMSQKSAVFEFGCGRGRISAHMATVSGCASLTGINTDQAQLESARVHAKRLGIDDRVKFRLRDMNDIPHDYPDESFDCIYHVAAFSYATNLSVIMKEIYRLLKPGGRFGCLDWVKLDGYKPEDEHHQRLMQLSKAFIGAVGTPSAAHYIEAAEAAGFRVIIKANTSQKNSQQPLLVKARRFYTPIRRSIKKLTDWGLIPSHLDALFQRLAIGYNAYLEAESKNICTMSYYIVAEKPAD